MRKALLVALFLVPACGGGGGGDDDDDDNVADASGIPPTAYLITQMTLADPHTFAVGGLLDVTGTVNDLISDSINMDATMPPDGLLDFSVVPLFRPLDQGAGASTPLEIVFADCTAPINGTSCTRGPDSTVVPATATNDDCLMPIAGTTGNYSPAIVTPSAPCFSSNAVTFDVALGDIILHLEDARISATYSGDPASSLTNGLIMGFLSEQQADMTILPEDIAVVGGEPLSTLLQDSDKDDNNGTSGWWFYLNFTAQTVTYSD